MSLFAFLQPVGPDDAPARGGRPAGSRPHRLPWAELLRRVFAQDILECALGGRRTVVAFEVDANLAGSLRARLGIAAEAATFAPRRASPQGRVGLGRPGVASP